MENGRPRDRDGVGASVIATPSGDWPTCLAFLEQRFPAVTAGEWLARVTGGTVVDERGETIRPDTPYRPNSRLFYFRSVAEEPCIPFAESVLFQDDLIIVADKPHFLPVTPSGRYVQETLLVRLKRRLGIETLAPMHRIDRDTAGLVLFTVEPHTRDAYQRLFRERSIEKTYEAIAPWRADLVLPTIYRNRLVESDEFMQMQASHGDANALTAIELIETSGAMARYRLRPLTGQKHQLRMHMAALGIPIVNDRIYPVLEPDTGAAQAWDRPLKLLAQAISFIDPITGRTRSFESKRTLSF